MEKQINLIAVDTRVRYWEDTDVNGTPDIDFYKSKGEGKPRIPCAVQVKDEPDNCIYSDHWRWRPMIEVETGRILNWTSGVCARVHYKVCDWFACMFVGTEGENLGEYEDYVPSFMCPEEDVWGDYIIMSVDSDGVIRNWNKEKVYEFYRRWEEDEQ